jgi:hypothetical protein
LSLRVVAVAVAGITPLTQDGAVAVAVELLKISRTQQVLEHLLL